MYVSAIQEFYKNSKIFVTGGTGFLGKLLIEKLLRDTEVDTIYLLVREKKGKDIQSRINELLQNVIFSRIKPELKNKIKPIAGDVGLPNLGLSVSDREMLLQNVDIIFHAAATVNFNEPIKNAFRINVKATNEMLRIAKEAKHLKVYMHVSTMYSNCILQVVEEKIYSHPYEAADLEKYLDSLTEEQARTLTKEILGEWPNTYTFTKALAERVLYKYGGSGLPVGIFRPSIVISTYKEPIPGWIDNLYGPTGVSVGMLSGAIRVMRGKRRAIADIVPGDKCVAGLIAAAWDVAEKCNASREVERSKINLPIYNYVSSAQNPIRWEEFATIGISYCLQDPYSKAKGIPYFLWVETKFEYKFLRFFLHYVPAAFVDLFRLLIGKKANSLKSYTKIHPFLNAIDHFTLREWKFENKNIPNLWMKMSQLDRELFPLSMTEFSWLVMFPHYVNGMKKYLLKEDDSKLDLAKRRLWMLKMSSNAVYILFTCIGVFFVFWILSKLFLGLFYVCI